MTWLPLLAVAGLLAYSATKVAHAIYEGSKRMSAATDRLNASVAALDASVEALIAKPSPNDDAALNATADHLDAIKAKVDAALAPVPA